MLFAIFSFLHFAATLVSLLLSISIIHVLLLTKEDIYQLQNLGVHTTKNQNEIVIIINFIQQQVQFTIVIKVHIYKYKQPKKEEEVLWVSSRDLRGIFLISLTPGN